MLDKSAHQICTVHLRAGRSNGGAYEGRPRWVWRPSARVVVVRGIRDRAVLEAGF